MRPIAFEPSQWGNSSTVKFCGKRQNDDDYIIKFPVELPEDTYGGEDQPLQSYHRFSVADLVEAAQVQQKPMAMVALAGRYETGIKRPLSRVGIFQPGLEVEKDLTKAEALYRRAVNLDQKTLFHLGRFLMLGKPKTYLLKRAVLKLFGKLPADTLEGAALLQLFANKTTVPADRMNVEHLIGQLHLSPKEQAEVDRKVTALEDEYLQSACYSSGG